MVAGDVRVKAETVGDIAGGDPGLAGRACVEPGGPACRVPECRRYCCNFGRERAIALIRHRLGTTHGSVFYLPP
jgi:hypothetical protein